MTLRKTIMLVCILLLPLSAPASENPQIYTIKKGDTLWGVSQKFLKDPYYWPNLWSHNPEIPNPHFIYPGQKLAIYDDRIELITAEPKIDDAEPKIDDVEPVEGFVPEETAIVETEQVGIIPQEEITVVASSGNLGFVSMADIESSGRIIDAVDNRLVLGPSDMVFLEMNDLDGAIPGTRYFIHKIGDKIRHPVTKRPVGFHIINIGQLEITNIHDEVASGKIISANREIFRDSVLLPYQEIDKEITLKKQSKKLSGYLISSLRGNDGIGQFDIIYSDIGGAAEGLEKGNMVNISRPRDASESSVADLKLPDVLVGQAVVTDVKESTSTLLVLKAAGSIYVGDRITTITN